MAKKIKTLHLTAAQLATLFTQLHHLESAGLPCNRAISIMAKTEIQLKKPLLFMQQQINSGKLVSEAGFKAGIFNDTHQMLLHAAEASGQLARVYKQLADYYTDLSSRIKRVKSRLFLSALVLTLALFIQPIPDLVSSTINVIQYLERSVGRLIIIALSIFISLRLPRIFCSLGIESVWHSIQLNTPIVKNWIIKRQLNQFFFILAIMLESGVSFSVALPKAVASIKNTRLQKQFDTALSMLSSGSSATNILSEVSVIDSTMRHIIATGEQSGKLASSILHFSTIEAETISLQDDTLAEWLVRLIYSVIAAWMAYSILNSSFMPTMPKDL
ncbi:Type II secretion system protein F [uncultured bacterium]|nr:Type II secretion system protein F [uncultured bacterium]